MSKLQLKIKDHDNNFIVLNNIRNLRFTLRNNREEVKDISSFGWRKVLDCAGSRHITIKINGILDSVLADELLRNSAMLNSNNDYKISFNAKEKIRLRCSVELYERYYDPVTFDQLCFFNFLSLVLLQLLFIILYFYSTKKCIFGNKKSNLLQKKNFISNSCYCLDLMVNEYVLSVCVGAHIH